MKNTKECKDLRIVANTTISTIAYYKDANREIKQKLMCHNLMQNETLQEVIDDDIIAPVMFFLPRESRALLQVGAEYYRTEEQFNEYVKLQQYAAQRKATESQEPKNDEQKEETPEEEDNEEETSEEEDNEEETHEEINE